MSISAAVKRKFSEVKIRQDAADDFDSAITMLQKDFAQLEDPRDQSMVIYPLDVVLTEVVLARLAGRTTAVEIASHWEYNQKFLSRVIYGLPDEVPDPSTIRAVIAGIDPLVLNDLVLKRFSGKHLLTYMVGSIAHDEIEGWHVLCADGQAVRASARHNKNNPKYNSGVNLVTIYDATARKALAQRAVTKKNQEAKAIKEMVPAIDLKQTIFTFDAINTHPDVLEGILAQEGHYLVSLKKNNGNTFDEIEWAFDALRTLEKRELNAWLKGAPVGYYTTFDNKGGKIITKEQWTLPADIAMNDDIRAIWPNIKTVIAVKTTMSPSDPTDKTPPSVGMAYFITDLEHAPGVENLTASDKIDRRVAERSRIFAKILLKRWGLETLHFYCDYHGTFNQDRHRCFRTSYIENSASLTKLACNIITAVQDKSVTVLKRNKGFSDRKLPFSNLVSNANANIEVAFGYLQFYFNNDMEPLYDLGIAYRPQNPLEEDRGHYELYSKDAGDFEIGVFLMRGGGRKKPNPPKNS